MKKLEKLTIRINEEIKKELETLASADDRTVSNYIHQILKKHVEQKKFEKKKSNQ